MDDEEVVCPLCCEDLDITDRQFYPCKCGYQVCMWCWHRIKESETGLCPACRTPYGDNPHAFSAVDVEEVLKANKEKEAAAKRERQRQQQQQQAVAAAVNPTDAEAVLTSLSGNRSVGRMDAPKDRNQLVGMRVIRRNLVYAVGLPPSIANEETLRKPEYFGQYGKIAKIVLNRGTPAQGRPSTSSAYVTFAHKEDTLACILALDGFSIEGRNIRASYGTSKYCSAYMRSMKCTNPECTYLHEMGDIEDTFTKAEIQAGFVTSGRDVLARQQQIVQQALSAASGAAGSAPRKRIGGGGPSGTGKAATNPIFPAPTFDEPARASTAHLVQPVSISTQKRASTTTAAFPAHPPSQHPRSASTGTTVPVAGGTASRKSAASIVAGVHNNMNVPPEPPASHTTLTPLTPLKRTNTAPKPAPKPAASHAAANQDMPTLPNMRTGPKKTNGIKMSTMSTSPTSDAGSVLSGRTSVSGAVEGVSSIGGDVIALPVAPPTSLGDPLGQPVGLATGAPHSHYQTGPSSLSELAAGGDGLGGLGGEVFDGPLQSNQSKSIIGGGTDKWNSGDAGISANKSGLFRGTGSGTIGGSSLTQSMDAIGGGFIGGGTIGSGSSALASMLGINLPSGSGSLRESDTLWTSSAPAPTPQASVSALNGNSVPMPGVIGDGSHNSNGRNSRIGGLPIGRGDPHVSNSGGVIGGSLVGGAGGVSGGGGGANSDIALLQSLLPGVHITSGGSYQGNGFGAIGGGSGGNTNGEWNAGAVGGLNAPGAAHQNGFGLQSSFGVQPQPIGTIGQGKQRQAPGNIW